MARKVTRFDLPVELTYDDEFGGAAVAVEDFYRMLTEVDQAGFMDRNHMEINYGGDPDKFSEPEDAEPDPQTCILTGAPGENPDDCTTHDHEEE